MGTITSLKVMLEYFHPWPNSAGFYLARERGYYQQAGLQVELALADPGRGDGLAYLQHQAADLAITPSNRLLLQRDLGAQIRSVAAINHQGLESIQTLTTKGIRRPRDLEGKRLALNPTPRGLAMVRHLVTEDGGDPDRVILVDAGVRELSPEALARGEADASFGGYWAWEALMESDVPPAERVVLPVDTIGAPRYHSYLLAARQSVLEQDPEAIQRFVQATARGFYEAAQSADAVAAIYERVTPYFPTALLRASAHAISPSWFDHGVWGHHQQPLLEQYAKWLAKYHILQNENIWQDAFTNAFLEVSHVK